MGVERRNHEAGTGNGNDQVYFVGAQTGALQTFFRGFLSQLDGVLNVFLIGLIQGARFDGVFDGKNGVAFVYLSIVHDGHHGFEAALRDIEDAPHVIFHIIAGDCVRRKGRGGSRDRTMC